WSNLNFNNVDVLGLEPALPTATRAGVYFKYSPGSSINRSSVKLSALLLKKNFSSFFSVTLLLGASLCSGALPFLYKGMIELGWFVLTSFVSLTSSTSDLPYKLITGWSFDGGGVTESITGSMLTGLFSSWSVCFPSSSITSSTISWIFSVCKFFHPLLNQKLLNLQLFHLAVHFHKYPRSE